MVPEQSSYTSLMNGYGIAVTSFPYQLIALRNRFMVLRCDEKSRVTESEGRYGEQEASQHVILSEAAEAQEPMRDRTFVEG